MNDPTQARILPPPFTTLKSQSRGQNPRFEAKILTPKSLIYLRFEMTKGFEIWHVIWFVSLLHEEMFLIHNISITKNSSQHIQAVKSQRARFIVKSRLNSFFSLSILTNP